MKQATKILSLLILSTAVVFIHSARSEELPEETEIGIVEKLGNTLPDGIVLKDEDGNDIELKDLIDRPTVISLVYFRCPGICSPLLNGLTSVVSKTDMTPGKEFRVITLSFDHNEDHELAASKKENYFKSLNRADASPESWRFLTGDSANIAKVADALGFKFKRTGNDFAHGASIMVVSREGKMIRYLFGTDYLPFDFKMAVTEAEEGRVTPTIAKVVKMCFSYDPDSRKYVLNVTRVAGGGILLLLLVFVGVLVFKKKKNQSEGVKTING